MKPIIKISKFSSLNFFHDWIAEPEKEAFYCQLFGQSDIISVQYLVNSDTPIKVYLLDLDAETTKEVNVKFIDQDENSWLYEFDLTNLPIGRYKLYFDQPNVNLLNPLAYSEFKVLDYSELKETVLLTYTNSENDFDTVFEQTDSRYFQFRVEGGFYTSEYQFQVDNEIFRTQTYSPKQVNAYPYGIRTLTIGSREGVPVWIGEKANFILSLTDVAINGVGYVRSESSTPEVNVIHDFYPLYVYKVDVEPAKMEYAHEEYLRGIEWILEHGSWDGYGLWTQTGIWQNPQ